MNYTFKTIRSVSRATRFCRCAAALTLSSVLRRNAAVVPEMALLEAEFDEAEGFDAWLFETARDVRELRLSAFGVAQQDFKDICELTFTAGRMDNNPIVFSQAQVMDILRENA